MDANSQPDLRFIAASPLKLVWIKNTIVAISAAALRLLKLKVTDQREAPTIVIRKIGITVTLRLKSLSLLKLVIGASQRNEIL